MNILQRGWQSLVHRFRSTEIGADTDVPDESEAAPKVSEHLWLVLIMGLAFSLLVGWAMVAINSETTRLGRAAGAVSDSAVQTLVDAQAVEADTPVFPAGREPQNLKLPDDWSATHPGYEGGVWYRFHFDANPSHAVADGSLIGAYIERACSTVEVHLNGHLVYRGGRMALPYARQCGMSHVVDLPVSLLRDGANTLDVKVVGYPIKRVTARQRAGGLASVQVGPMEDIRVLHSSYTFWTSTVSQVLGGVLAVLGLFALGLAWVRRLDYLVYFGLLTLGWSLISGQFGLQSTPVANTAMEVLLAMMYAPMTAFAIKFLLGYAGQGMRFLSRGKRRRQLNWALWAQCFLLPVSLLAGPDHLFLLARLWYVLFALEIFAAIGCFLWVTGRQGRRPEFWLMSGALGAVAAVMGIELSYQNGLVRLWGLHVTYLVMPLLYAAVAVRLIQVYARALKTAEGARAQLERRVQEISAEIERNFNQIAELRVEQIAEKERKRIAADLHDDLGAKLLTIVHTSDNDRISTLAREALEEMRLSVRGLTGRPMVLSDALADWRSEVVSRLGQAGIECEWRNPNDTIEEPLSSRTYVQTTRIVREAVSNIIKHSSASHVIIQAEVHLDLHDFVLLIQDNGKGIPLELDGRLDRGHGMTSMKHRAKQLNGQCLVESGPGFGTVIRLTLPLEVATMQTPKPATSPAAAAVAASMRDAAVASGYSSIFPASSQF
ncbi:MAG: histidine kinase [Burkholderiales bacterium]|nr:histidine kinase [Burkholderiales bacterium]